MAVEIHETVESRKDDYDPPASTQQWVCEGEFDNYQVGVLARNTIPTSYQHPLALLYRNNMQIQEAGHQVYNITVFYGIENRDIGSYRIECDAMGGTTNVKAGVPVATFPSGMPDLNGIIGYKGHGEIEGVDIVIPAMRLIVHFTHPGNYLTNDVIRTIGRLVGSVDMSGFLGNEPYETLFLGLQASQTTNAGTLSVDHREEVSYHFAISENLVNYQIGNITGVSKKGWDVATVNTGLVVQNGRPSAQVDFITIARVYRERNFKTILGFG